MLSKLFPVMALFLIPGLYAYAGDGQPEVIASFATSIEDQDEAVRHNIRLACSKLNGRVIPPKSILSFNETVGEGSIRNGYRSGAVLYRDEVRHEPGGGLCLDCLPCPNGKYESRLVHAVRSHAREPAASLARSRRLPRVQLCR